MTKTQEPTKNSMTTSDNETLVVFFPGRKQKVIVDRPTIEVGELARDINITVTNTSPTVVSIYGDCDVARLNEITSDLQRDL